MAQSADSTVKASADTTLVPSADSTPPKSSTLTLGSVYANNASYYGQKSAERMPYIALAAVYQHRSGFYVKGMGYRLLKDTSSWASAYSVGAGYSFTLYKSLTADISYDYCFYPKLSPFLQAANPHSINLTFSREGKVNLSLAGDYAFGKTNDIFVTPQIGKDVNLFSITKKDIVTISPSLDVTVGTQYFYAYYLEQKNIRDSVLSLVSHVLGGPSPAPKSTTKTTSTFDLLSYNLKLPLAYNRSHLKLEIAAQLSLLSNQAQSDPGKLNSFFSASFYYQF